MESREPRRKDRKISEQEAVALLERAMYGVLATVDAQGHPYGVPISYVWLNGAVYVHAALKGHKIENIQANSNVSFTVVGDTQPVYETNNFSTYYESAIVFGTAVEVVDPDERYAALYALAKKYLPEHLGDADASIAHSGNATVVYVIRPKKLTGKAKRKKPTAE